MILSAAQLGHTVAHLRTLIQSDPVLVEEHQFRYDVLLNYFPTHRHHVYYMYSEVQGSHHIACAFSYRYILIVYGGRDEPQNLSTVYVHMICYGTCVMEALDLRDTLDLHDGASARQTSSLNTGP